ncbi:MAG: hypothetical protein JWO90_369, partial [Solirubrobacterales bacterium]|nr:hypothetical protein [Solirubrobacterales bacterium]
RGLSGPVGVRSRAVRVTAPPARRKGVRQRGKGKAAARPKGG